ncbi:hypothetical protein [Phenylobacterium sp.]|uniref:hypothetical protein n=1 Tax=Phenylobacterium sp. TaxID=1871053 RepID=UPI0025DC08F9|nr:hypothetical protein [Phenylobacterium sp.]
MPALTIEDSVRQAFQIMAVGGRGDAGALAAGLRRDVTGLGLRALAAKLLHVSVCTPERLLDVYDAAAHGWLSGQVYPPSTRNTRDNGPPDAFWRDFWKLLEGAAAERRRVPFTRAAIRLTRLLDKQLDERVAATALDYRGAREAAAKGLLEHLDVRELAHAAPSHLGGLIYREAMLREQQQDCIHPAEWGFDRMPPPLGYLNARILESHVAWAVVGGYSHAELDELALAAFQTAQFGHHYSSVVLALTMATVAIERPAGLEIVLESVFRGWLHGRQTPPLLGVAWRELLDLPLDAVRQALGVVPFASPLAAAVRLSARGAR